MRVLVTGSDGFIGRNLLVRLSEISIKAMPFTSADNVKVLNELVNEVDFIFHLAGVNRPRIESDFAIHNKSLTESLCASIKKSGRSIPILFTSSSQASIDNAYGRSKRLSEESLTALGNESDAPIYIYRLPNVFGKWSRPNYNSVVATFCHNISQNIPIRVDDPERIISLVYIDDVINEFLKQFQNPCKGIHYKEVKPIYSIRLGDLAKEIECFGLSRKTLITPPVGSGLTRALYSTYLSYLTPSQFKYSLNVFEDNRGQFVEMLKTKNSGQISFFTAHPGVTRGGHYHHSKAEKFLILQGTARFTFRHILTKEYSEIIVNGVHPEVVETVPGWAHEITNIGSETMIVMIWANELFDIASPDTFAMKVKSA